MRRLVLLIIAVLFVLTLAASFRVDYAGAETREGTFVIRCDPSHVKQEDPVVNPGPPGTLSEHPHQFFGNRSTGSESTYQSMLGKPTTCRLTKATEAYWTPTLLRPDGSVATPRFSFFYYKNIPVNYRQTVAFPPDFRMIFRDGPKANSFWDCFGGQPTGKFESPPLCSNSDLQFRLKAPNCWNGFMLDSPTHDTHVVYPVKNACPAAYPVKLPMGNFFIRWSPGSGGPGWHFADEQDHVDFWNTWDQPTLESLVTRCLHAGKNCGQVTDANFAGL